MKRAKLWSVVLLACAIGTQAQVKSSLVEYVNPLIGTDKMGHVFPGACVPFGIVQLSPVTVPTSCTIRSRLAPVTMR